MTMSLTYENDNFKHGPGQFHVSNVPNNVKEPGCTEGEDCQRCAVKDTIQRTQAANFKPASSDSFFSAQPSFDGEDDSQNKIQDPIKRHSVDSERESWSPVSNSQQSIHAADELERINTSSQRQATVAVAIKGRSAAIIPSRAIQRSSTFDVLKSIVKVASLHIRSSIKRIGSDLDERLTKDVARSRKRPQQRPKNLGDCLRVAVKHSPLCKRGFLPNSTLRELVTAESVDEELARIRWKSLPRLVSQRWRHASTIRLGARGNQRDIVKLRSHSTSELLNLKQDTEQTYRRVFALLAFIEKPTCIWDFVDEGICDEVLPLLQETHDGSVQRQGSESAKPLRCFRNWKRSAIHEFLERRWIFLAPRFSMYSKIVEHRVFRPEEILPITSWEVSSLVGASGQVYKAEIHSSHHAFDKNVVAVKQLIANSADPIRNEEDFMNESGILRSLGRAGHMNRHLITLLATFKRCDTYYLVFPWADRDLEAYWKHVIPKPDMEAWLIEQLRGLAEAMSFIHKYETTSATKMPHESSNLRRPAREDSYEHEAISLIGRHGDIKPTNILWFAPESGDGYGILKITDFGIARFTPENIDSKRKQGFVPNSVTYRSPECDVPDKHIGAHCDVWALGCVFLVSVTWFFGGYKAVEEFTESRQSRDTFWAGMNSDNFFTIKSDAQQKPQAEVKPAVRIMINRLRAHVRCTPPFKKLLDLIEQDMVIIQKQPESVGLRSMTGSLEVPRAPRPRRLSAGNIARELG